uniref:hypothetical protein n=1 Tax=Candidatus Magnetobacterium casense TaxID=1455061 RepID=UPI0012DCD79C
MYGREYDPQKLQQILRKGGSTVYFSLVYTKVRALYSQLLDLIFSDKRVFDIVPSTDIEIEESFLRAATSAIIKKAAEAAQAQTAPPVDAQYEQKLIDDIKEQIQTELHRRSQEKAIRMGDLIEDQLRDGGFYETVKKIIKDMLIMPVGALKGPVLRRKQVTTYKKDVDGKWWKYVQDRLVPSFNRVSFFDIFFSPSANNVNDSYVIERHRMHVNELMSLIGVEGFFDQEIEDVLYAHESKSMTYRTWIDSARELQEGHTYLDVLDEDLTYALEFWGMVRGRYLREFGFTEAEVPNPALAYEVEAWLIAGKVIKCIINPGPKPYHIVSFEDMPDTIWGCSLADILRDDQTAASSNYRSLINNII